jgi:hypothetical protein
VNRSWLVLLLLLTISGAALALATAYVAIDNGKTKEGEGYGLFIVAEQLHEKPQNYLSLTNPDSYVSKAISNLGETVIVGSWANTQIDDMIQANNTNNIETNNHYYSIAVGSADPPPLIGLGLIYWIISGWIMWGCLTILSAAVIRSLRTRSNKTAS